MTLTAGSLKTIKFLKQPARMIPNWQMYGHIYYEEKLKPLVDWAHDAACLEHGRKLNGSGNKKAKEPLRVTSWNAVAKEQFKLESEDVKKRVQDALQEQAKMIQLSKEPMRSGENEDERMVKLQA